MKFKNIKLKIKKYTYTSIFFILLNLLVNPSILKGMANDFIEEKFCTVSHTQPLLSEEDYIDNIPSSSEQIELKNLTTNLEDESALVVRTNKISSSYMLAFQDDAGTKFSKNLFFKYAICLFGEIGPIIPQLVIPRLIGEEYASKFLGYLLTGTTPLTNDFTVIEI